MGLRCERDAAADVSCGRVRESAIGPPAQDLRRRDQDDHPHRRSGIDFHHRRTLALKWHPWFVANDTGTVALPRHSAETRTDLSVRTLHPSRVLHALRHPVYAL